MRVRAAAARRERRGADGRRGALGDARHGRGPGLRAQAGADDMGALVCRTGPSRRRWRRPRATCSRRRGRAGAAAVPHLERLLRAGLRAFPACARYHRLDARSTVAAGSAHSLLLGAGDDEDNLSGSGRGTCGQLGLGAAAACDAADAAGAGPARRQRRGGRAPLALRLRRREPLGLGQGGGPPAGHARRRRDGAGAGARAARGGPAGAAGRGRRGALARRRRGRGPLELGPQRARPAGPRHGAADRPRRGACCPCARGPSSQAAAGAFHSLAVLREGALYAFGLGADGRLGLGHQLNATLPEMVPLHQFVRQAAAGATHSACCDSAGCLYTWGDGAKGALGHLGPRPRKNKNDTGLASMPSWESALRLGEALQHSGAPRPRPRLTPRPVAALRHVRVVQVQCNERETVALDGDGVVYVVGQASALAAGASPTLPRKTPETSPLAGIGRARAPSVRRRRAQARGVLEAEVRRRRAPLPRAGPRGRVVGAPRRRAHDRGHGRSAWGGGDGGAGLGVGDAKGRARPTMLPPWN